MYRKDILRIAATKISSRLPSLPYATMRSAWRRPTGLKFDPRTFYSETAVWTVQCTLRTDFIPEVGPSDDQPSSVELGPSCQASEASPPWPWGGRRDPKMGVSHFPPHRYNPGTLGAACGGLRSLLGGSRVWGRSGRTRIREADYASTRVNIPMNSRYTYSQYVQ